MSRTGEDYEIFCTLYRNYAPMIFGIIRRCTQDEALTEAIFSDIFAHLIPEHKNGCQVPVIIRQTFKSITGTLGDACAAPVMKDYLLSLSSRRPVAVSN